MWLVTIPLFFLFLQESTSNTHEIRCKDAGDCDSCIQRDAFCAWCLDKNYENSQRCLNISNNPSHSCKHIYRPESKIELIEQEKGSIFKLKPKEAKISLVAGSNTSFLISVDFKRHMPTDLYILVDFSKTMDTYLEELKGMVAEIGEKLSDLGSYRFGLGAFVDKPILPFSHGSVQDCCVAPFSYRNVLPLQNNASRFKAAINQLKISTNVDSQEGTLDAIHQAAVCEKEVGWKPLEKARRVILVLTDGRVKVAGDGRVGGIIRPHDGKCYLNKAGFYDRDEYFDYISMAKLEQSLQKSGISILFAPTEDLAGEFETISKQLEINSAVAFLNEDSGSILSLVGNVSQTLSKQVSLTFEENEHLSINYEPLCRERDGVACKNVMLGDVVSFSVELRVKKCPTKPITPIRIPLYISGLSKVELFVDITCGCQCSLESDQKKANKECNFNGALVCGKCKCFDEWIGENCDCNTTGGVLIDSCINPNSTDLIACSGHGTCLCGKCHCLAKPYSVVGYTGKFCECSENFCLKYQGEVCGGAERGKCSCNKCICDPKFEGENCGIRNCNHSFWEEKCRRNNLTCGGHGHCECGKCVCHLDYEGNHCEQKILPQCSELFECIECKVFDKFVCSRECNTTEYQFDHAYRDTSYICSFEYRNGCVYEFDREYNGDRLVLALKPLHLARCSQKLPNYIIAIIVGTAIMLLFLILLACICWIKSAYNKKRMADYNLARRNSVWAEENPIYSPKSKAKVTTRTSVRV